VLDREIFCLFETEWGWMGAVQGENGFRRIVLPSERSQVLADISSSHPVAAEDPSPQPELSALFNDYFLGTGRSVSLDLDWSGHSAFSILVWRAAQSIAWGEVRTYQQLSGAVGHPTACRAVGTALGRNPFPLVVPCHRIVHSDGSLGGFSAPSGIALKRRLLEREGVSFDRRGRVVNVVSSLLTVHCKNKRADRILCQ